MHYYQVTKYPRIFKDTYWGWFNVESERLAPEITNNRNGLVEEFGIVRFKSYRCDDVIYRSQPPVDHLESYVTGTGRIVVIFSPYDRGNVNGQMQAANLGFSTYKDLYCSATTTYIMTFKDLQEYKNHCLMLKRRASK